MKIIIFSWLFWGLTALFIHGKPPLHYFVFLFPLPPLILGIILSKLWSQPFGKFLVILILSLIAFLNFGFLFSERYFYRPSDKVSLDPWYVPFRFQKEVIRLIVEDAQGRPFNLARVGPFDYFEGDFAQNYRYLAWWLGNEPTEEKTKLRYTIYEDQAEIPEELPEGAELFQIAKMAILKEEK